jgi:hypothetical protein
MSSNITINPDLLPPSLRLPPHLSAHKYFFVCTLTVAAWDSLVLSPRTLKLFKTEGWPVLKVIFMFLRILMPAEFIAVGMSQPSCFVPQQADLLVYLQRYCVLRHGVVQSGKFIFFWPQCTLNCSQACQRFFLFEPICTAILLASCSGMWLSLDRPLLGSIMGFSTSCPCNTDSWNL